jgi:cell division protein FtsQ
MKAIKRFFHIIIWGLLVAGVVLLIAFAEKKHSETVCESFELKIINEGENALTSEDDIRRQIIAVTDTLTGKTLAEIEPVEIYSVLDRNPYIKYADIKTSIDGRMNVEVTLRQAIARFINKDGLSYYVDRDGWIMPLNTGYPSRVVIISGHISDGINREEMGKLHVDSLPETSPVRGLYRLAVYIHTDDFLKRLISQVYMDRQGELELSPMIGNYSILFGKIEGMNKKFEKLTAYYFKGAGKAGWIDYRSIDLRYKNQVICSK